MKQAKGPEDQQKQEDKGGPPPPYDLSDDEPTPKQYRQKDGEGQAWYSNLQEHHKDEEWTEVPKTKKTRTSAKTK